VNHHHTHNTHTFNPFPELPSSAAWYSFRPTDPGGWKAELHWVAGYVVRQFAGPYEHKWWVTWLNLCSSCPSIRGHLLCFVYRVKSLYRSGPNGLWTESIWPSHTAGAGPGPPTPRINSLVNGDFLCARHSDSRNINSCVSFTLYTRSCITRMLCILMPE